MKTLYQSNTGELYEVKEEAILADLIDESTIYLESYRIGSLVKYLATRLSFTVLPKVELEPELELELEEPKVELELDLEKFINRKENETK